jgi:hypothetical protein
MLLKVLFSAQYEARIIIIIFLIFTIYKQTK